MGHATARPAEGCWFYWLTGAMVPILVIATMGAARAQQPSAENRWFGWFKAIPSCNPSLRPDVYSSLIDHQLHVVPETDDVKDPKTGQVIATRLSFPEHGKISAIYLFRYKPDCERFANKQREMQNAADSRYDPVQEWWQFNEAEQTCTNSHLDPIKWRERVRIIYGEPTIEDGGTNPATGKVDQLVITVTDRFGQVRTELLFRTPQACEAIAREMRQLKPKDRYK